jgi:hypothetical protein
MMADMTESFPGNETLAETDGVVAASEVATIESLVKCFELHAVIAATNVRYRSDLRVKSLFYVAHALM